MNILTETMVDTCIQNAVQYLLDCQQPDGHWVGEAEGDTILESEYILLLTILGWDDSERIQRAAEYIRRKQLPDGGWAIFHGGPPDLSASAKAYFALKLAGDSPDMPHMQRAKSCVLSMGGAAACNSYTRFYLAATGQIPWDAVPAVPPEIILLPRWFYVNIYEISSWSRTFVVPLSIIWAYRPTIQLSPEKGIPELFVDEKRSIVPSGLSAAKRFFLLTDRALKSMEQRNLLPWRAKALDEAEQWMLGHFEMSSGIGAIFPPMVYALIALRCLGYPDDHPQVQRARRELQSLELQHENGLKIQPCTSPVWDTAIVINSLLNAGIQGEHPSLKKASEWILSKEVRHPGDWSIKRPDLEPGGWYFEYENEFYPDIDDTAMVLLALKDVPMPEGLGAIDRGMKWVLGMQGKDGGWGSFDVDNNRKLLCDIPFADHNAMIDPSTVDITARILEMLASYGYDQSHPQVRRAIRFVLDAQETDGSWFGRWGVNYIYGTWQSLKGLTAIGLPTSHPSIKRGADWLLNHQNTDGGWGESCYTYHSNEHSGKGESTASQTAWALMGLISAGFGNHTSVERGVAYLVETQNTKGSWDEEAWTGTGFPCVFYLKYHLYSHSFPLWALGMYSQFVSGQERIAA